MKSFLIIGMGSFGHHLCRKLCEQKCEIMIVDERADALEDMLPYVTSAKIGDCTNIDVLQSFGIHHFDACFVCRYFRMRWRMQRYAFSIGYKGIKKAARLSRFFYL